MILIAQKPTRMACLLVCLAVLVVCSATGCNTAGYSSTAVAAVTEAGPHRDLTFRYEVDVHAVPTDADSAYLWVPVPPTTTDQTIHQMKVETTLPYVELNDSRYGNAALRFELQPGVKEQTIVLEFELTRYERIRSPLGHAVEGESMIAGNPALWLSADRRVPITGQVLEWARETTEDKQGALEKAKAIYDYAVTELKYDKSGTGWGNGDIFWACDAKRGNCTDFHALFIGFNRALGIPARFEMGFPIPADRSEGEIGGYHCWAQFHLEDAGWIPVDASEACKNPDKRGYYFGAHDRDRVLFSVGRDLLFDGMQAGPLNYFIYPHVEVDGVKWGSVDRHFSYRDTVAGRS
jgi:transglutaminase-like putative cysteine protease